MPIKLPRIRHWIKGWRLDKAFDNISEEAKVLIPIALGIVDKFKTLLDGEVADVVTALIPWGLDDKIREGLQDFLPKLILRLDIANVTANIEDSNERLKAILALFKFTDDEEKHDFYTKFGYRIIEFMADGNLSRTEAIVLGQTWYEFKYKKAA